MPQISPRARLASVILLLAAALVAHTLPGMLAAYGAALLAACVAGVAREHARFVALAAMPLLAALLIVWGWLIPEQHPPTYANGAAYALAAWLRIVACGAALQALLIPLINRPAELNRFLAETRTPTALAQVLITAVIFLPEVGRRLARLTEARAAQGYPSHLLARVGAIPQLLMPLVSSLLDTAGRRAEFWSHRGVLVARGAARTAKGSRLHLMAATMLGAAALAAAIAL